MPSILRGAPYFPVADVASIGAYYRDVLGFRCEYSAGEPPEFAVYSRNGSPIMFRRVADGSRICPNEQQGGTWDVFFWVDDVESLHNDRRPESKQTRSCCRPERRSRTRHPKDGWSDS